MSDVLSAVSENGWIINVGEMPVARNIKVDTKWCGDVFSHYDDAGIYDWKFTKELTHWRLHKAADGDTWKSLETAYDHLNTGNWQDTPLTALPKRMSAAEYIQSIDPFLEKEPIGLPLSRVCKAFEAITGKPMSEEHAETFVQILEMCKGFATKEDSL